MEKINILMLNYEFPPLGGGAGNANYYILKEMARYPDLHIDLVTSSVGDFRVEQFADNITIHYLDIKKNERNAHYQSNKDLLIYSLKALCYARTLKKIKKYDLCHAFFGIPCGYLAMRLKIPYIVSLRGSDVPFYNRRFFWLDKLFFRRLSCKIWKQAKDVIANSQGLKELALASCPDQEIAVIYNGVNLEEFQPPKKNTVQAEEREIKLISVGRLIERKGYRYLIEALQGLDNVQLILIGDGNQKNELEELARKKKVRVNFLGKVDHAHLAGHLHSADIFILPSLNEGMSNALLEAMACGLPVIATNTGGSSELIQNNGFIVAPGSAAALREAIKKLTAEPDLIYFMGDLSRKLAENMAWEKVAQAYRSAYYRSLGIGSVYRR